MAWKAVTLYQPFVSPKARLGIATLIIVPVIIRSIMEFDSVGFSPAFWLYAGFVMVAAMLEWKHYNKPREIYLELSDGRLMYCNQYTGEIHTVYQSRTQKVEEEKDRLVFYSTSNYATHIPLQFFNPEQVTQLKANISDWKKRKAESID
jgi:hypothetical protein